MLGLLLAAAPPAFAQRGYNNQITELPEPFGLTVDYSDSLWVANGGNGGQISEYGPFSSNLVGTLSGIGSAFYDRSLALDGANGYLYLANSGSVKVDVFENGTGPQIEEWGGFGGGFNYLAIDNSGGPSNGTVYVAATSPDNIQAFHPDHTQAEFSASESYTAGNRITGSPNGHFGFIRNIGVDSHGNIYLVDQEKAEVDEFKPSGEFIQSFKKAGLTAPTAVAVDPTNGNVLIVDEGNAEIDEFSPSGEFLAEINGSETPAGSFGPSGSFSPTDIAFNSEGYLYVSDREQSVVDIFTPDVPLPKISYEPTSNAKQTSVTLNAKVDPNGDEVSGCYFEYGTSTAYGSPHIPCSPAPPYSGTTESVISANISGLSAETTYHYRVILTDASGHPRRGVDQTFTLHAVANPMTTEATNLTPTKAQLNGSFLGNGKETHYYFEWGTTPSYGQKTTEEDAGSPAGPGPTEISAPLTGLEPATTYHYRLVAFNSVGKSIAGDQEFTTPPAPPLISGEKVGEVHADTAQVHAQINPGGGETSYHVAYGTSTEYGLLAPIPDADAGSGRTPQSITVQLSGLSPGTTYHYQVVATNGTKASTNTTQGLDRTFTTLPFAREITDTCPNAHVRQQTSAAQLLDCRAYELVSAPYTAGYDVESNIVPGQNPLAGYPRVAGRVLYGIHDGAIPGVGYATNLGVAPYLATRGQNGWRTEYIGIPSNATPSAAPFASNLLEADAGLDTFAFGGAEICSPCFADGSTGVPLRLPDGGLVQGMAGPLNPGSATESAGYVAKPLSEDGSHLLFGSTAKFAPGGNEGQISIYDRNLKTNETQVVSDTQTGNPIPCLDNCSSDGIAELDISKDGSHILLGQLVSEANGAKYWHLFMNVGDSTETLELTPGANKGVLFDGMTADGTKVFFSSEEHLTGEDEQHTGADIFMWEEGHPLTLISKGSEGNASSCDPAANTVHEHWNTSQKGVANCGDVAVGGGGGVASGDGTIYFLSPSLLDGTEEPADGVKSAPNLYIVRPGSGPHFVATLDSSLNAPFPPKSVHQFTGSFGSFEKPTAVAIAEGPGEEGDTYVLDTSQTLGGLVKKLDPSGNPIKAFGKNGKLAGQSAKGSGDLQSGSTTIESVMVSSGAFSVGQEISGAGIPAGATITAVGTGSLEISEPATASGPATLSGTRSFFEYGYAGMPGAIAVDNDPSSPSYRDLYVPDFLRNIIDKFSPSGEFISQIEPGSYEIFSGASFPSGVAVDPANGDLYVSEFFNETGSVDVFDPNGKPMTKITTQNNPTGVGVASDGTVYVVSGGGLFQAETGTDVYEPSSQSPLEYNGEAKVFDSSPSYGVAVAPEGSVYVDEGLRVSQFDPAGHSLGAPLGVGLLKEHPVLTGAAASIGLGASSSGLVISNPGSGPGESGNLAAYRSLYPPSPQTDNPLAVDSVSAAEVRHTADFQITPSGDDAVFPSTLALAGRDEETAGHTEVYRYDAPTEELDCVSCTPTGAPSAGEAGLAPNGLSITDEGRVFFATTDQLTADDTDNKQDVYEWEQLGEGNCSETSLSFSRQTNDCLALISAGTSAFDSGLLGVDANGKDAYFFTRDSLVPQDKNGPTVKIYDAREGGGFPFEPPPAACKASDECHGASSPAPPPLEISSESGTSHNYSGQSRKCKQGYVKKHKVCVRKPKPPKHHRRAAPRQGARK